MTTRDSENSAWKLPSKQTCISLLRGWKNEPKKRDMWNSIRFEHPDWHPDLPNVNFSREHLAGANLSHATLNNSKFDDADLNDANLEYSNLMYSSFKNTQLHNTNLQYARLGYSRLVGANLNRADLSYADLGDALLTNSDFSHARLSRAILSSADLSNANLSEATLDQAHMDFADMTGAIMKYATCGATIFNATRLGALRDLEDLASCRHTSPSSIDSHALKASKGCLPDAFLRGIGLERWEVELAKLYDPTIQGSIFVDRLYRVYDMREKGPLGGVFVSYSHADDAFVDKMQRALNQRDVNVWRDVHDLRAGPLVRQVVDAIRRNDVVLLVLSEASLHSDWVEFEIEKARKREKEESRVILCPVSIDDTWKQVREHKPAIAQLAREYNIVNFDPSRPMTEVGNARQFQKLIEGMKIFYRKDNEGGKK